MTHSSLGLGLFRRAFFSPVIAAVLLTSAPQVLLAESFQSAFPETYAGIDATGQVVLDRIEIESGQVDIGSGLATAHLPENYYFIGPEGSRVVLEDIWGNPPDEGVMGMIFPRGASPLEADWGLTIEFDAMGYVSDADAAEMDYGDLLKSMQSDTLAANTERKKQGYPAITLVGWAEPPHYESATRELYWAKELAFEGSDEHTLNYNIRELGRRGVLVMNFIATMQELPQVKQAVPDVLQMIDFNHGNRYSDYVPGTDTVAAVGLGGLIAGKVMAKAGLLAVAIALLKKGGVLIFLPLVWLWRRFFGGKSGAGS